MFLTESSSYFFFNDTATTEIYTLALHDALPISGPGAGERRDGGRPRRGAPRARRRRPAARVARLELGVRHGQLRAHRKSTRLNSSHANIPYAVFCLKKKKTVLYFKKSRN